MEELLGRQAPHSAPAEQAVIGAMLIDPSCIPDVIEKVKSDEFYIQANRDIFDTIFAMFSYGQSVDAVTVLEQMKVRGVFKDTTQQYLMEVMQVTPTAANVLKYAAIVRDQALLRNVITVCEETVEAASSGAGEAGDVLDLCEKKIYALRQDRVVGGLMPVSQVVNSVYSNLSELAASGQPIPGIPTGFRDVDRRIMGMNKGDFILAGIDGDHLLQAVDVAVEMNRNRDLGIPVPDYVDENVSDKVVKIIQSYTGVVNKMVWRKY